MPWHVLLTTVLAWELACKEMLLAALGQAGLLLLPPLDVKLPVRSQRLASIFPSRGLPTLVQYHTA